jgi:hypothetical protein
MKEKERKKNNIKHHHAITLGASLSIRINETVGGGWGERSGAERLFFLF